MQMSSRDRALLELNKISRHEHSYDNSEQLISHLIMQMQSTDKFVGFAAAKAMYSVLISNKELAVHSLALTGLFGDIQAAFMHPTLFVEFSLELISKLLKNFQVDHVRLSGIFVCTESRELISQTDGACQLYFECLQKLWPELLGLQLQLGGQHAVSMVPFVSLTNDILKFKLASDGCITCDGGCHCVNSHSVEGAVLSCQTCIVNTCTHNTLPKILGHCSNLFELKKCLGLFTRICSSSRLLDDQRGLCSAMLDTITSSSLVKDVLLNWLLLQSESTDIHCIRDLFGVNATAETFAEVDADDKSLLATVVRKLTVLTMKCLSVTVDGGNGIEWLCQFEPLWRIPAASNKFENSLRNVMLEILLDQDSAMMDALCCCLKITKIVTRGDVSSGSVLCSVVNIHLLFIKFLSAISYDHLVLVDYVISDETCFVAFLTQYSEHIYDDWCAFTSSHHKLEDIMKMADRANYVGEIETPFSLSRKRKRSHQTKQFAYTSVVSQDVRLEECDKKNQATKSLVPYNLSDSSEDEPVDQSLLCDTMSCIIRLRLALERMLAKQIILNPQAPTKLVSIIEKVETLYETIHT